MQARALIQRFTEIGPYLGLVIYVPGIQIDAA